MGKLRSVMKRAYFMPLFLVILAVCCGQHESKQADCSKHYDSALTSLQHYFNIKHDSIKLLETLDLYDKAIQCDTTNINAYQGKFTTVYLLGRYKESLKILDKIGQIGNYRDVKVLVSIGLVYERMDRMDSAKNIYNRALLECDKQFEKYPADSIRIICDKLYILAVDRGKEYSLKQLDQYLSDRPEDQMLLDFKLYLRDFDKNRILFK